MMVGATMRSAVLALLCIGDAEAREPGLPVGEGDVLIEIPAGGSVKYETDQASGRLRVDRFLAMGKVYPANYGSMLQTLAPDGDRWMFWS
jgi:hypothetical protein